MKLSVFPRGHLIPCFYIFLMCDVILAGDHPGKRGEKHLVMVEKKKDPVCLLCLELTMLQGQMCCESKNTEIHKQFGMAAQA